ncbi:MAG: hypothetical protein AAF715_08445 [Myxococcota bacterium]
MAIRIPLRAIILLLFSAASCSSAPASPAAGPPQPGSPEEKVVAPGANEEDDARVSAIEAHEGERTPLPQVAPAAAWDATFKPSAFVLEGTAAAALQTYVPRTGEMTFMADALPRVPRVGQTMLVAGKALVRVKSVARQGRSLLVQTEPGNLAEVIQDGRFSFQTPVDLDAARITLDLPDEGRSFLAQTTVEKIDKTTLGSKDGIKKWSISRGDLTYEIVATPKKGTLEVEAKVIKKKGAKATLAYVAKATVNNLVVKGGGAYQGGKLSELKFKQEDLDVDVELSLQAAGSGLGKVDLTLPEPAITLPITVGPLVFTAKVGLKLIGAITIPGTASAQAYVKFKYRGDTELDYDDVEMGVKVEGKTAAGKVTAKANTKVIDIDTKPFDSAAMIGLPVDAQFGIAVPRLSIGLFGTGIVPYMHVGFVAGSRLKWGPLCKSGYIKMVKSAGYDFSVLGVKLRSDKLFVEEKGWRSPKGGCPKK